MNSQDAHEAAARLREALEEHRETVSDPRATTTMKADAQLGARSLGALPALLAEHDARQLRTMGSAPRDGTLILGLAPEGGFQTLSFRPDRFGNWGWLDYHDYGWAPLSWMPLPEVPHE